MTVSGQRKWGKCIPCQEKCMFKSPVTRSTERIGIKGSPVQLEHNELRQVQGEMTWEKMKIVQIIQSFVGLVKTFKLFSGSVARRITCSYLYLKWLYCGERTEMGHRIQVGDLERFLTSLGKRE